jgi:hypothetical protein
MPDRCQVLECEKNATYRIFPANAVHPSKGGMQTCDDHLNYGMSHIVGQPAPEHWCVFPVHVGNNHMAKLTSVEREQLEVANIHLQRFLRSFKAKPRQGKALDHLRDLEFAVNLLAVMELE